MTPPLKYALLLLFVLTVGLVGGYLGGRLARPAPVSFPDQKGSPGLSEAAASVTPAVVAVRSYSRSGNTVVSGSAVIVSADGYLATNLHVIADARRIRVTLSDRREFAARVVGVDEPTDLALLKVSADSLPYLTFGDSDALGVGEWVMAVGNPFRLRSTVTAGIVSAKGRSIDVLTPDDRIESFIQTDAAVNPGNSGGALVNTRGELIGINTAIISSSGRHEGFAFAIPGGLAERVLHDLKTYGEVKRAVLGIWVQGVNDAQARRLGLPDARGALVINVNEDSPADRAGLRAGDVVTAVDGVAINSRASLQEQLSRYRPGHRISVALLREGKQRELQIVLRDKGNRPGRLVAVRSADLATAFGVEVADDGPEGGVRVTAVREGSRLDAVNLQKGFVITHLNGHQMLNALHFLEKVEGAGEGLYLEGFYPGYAGRYSYRIP